MTNEKVLEKAIEKAEKNGYHLSLAGSKLLDQGGYRAIIFSHYFAKAFWGEAIHGKAGLAGDGLPGWKCENCGGDLDNNGQKEWQYHLQLLVLEMEPLKYLSKFL